MESRGWDWERMRTIAGFAWREEKKLLSIGLLVLLLVSFIVLPVCGASGHTDWWGYAEPISGVLTLALAGIIWLGQLGDRWLASLPKELTVAFSFEGRLVMRCERAYLASEADIRAWAQQLGSQMASKDEEAPARLSMRPDVRQDPAKVARLDGRYVLSYTVHYNLRSIPKNVQPLFERGGHVEWKRPDYSFPLD